jgi:hypothetical protein
MVLKGSENYEDWRLSISSVLLAKDLLDYKDASTHVDLKDRSTKPKVGKCVAFLFQLLCQVIRLYTPTATIRMVSSRRISKPAGKALTRRSTHLANTPAASLIKGLCTVVRSPSERKRSKGGSQADGWMASVGSRRLYTHGLYSSGSQLIADTVDRETTLDTTRYTFGEPPGQWNVMRRPTRKFKSTRSRL